MQDWAFLSPSTTIFLIKPSLSLGCIIIVASNWSLCKTTVRMVLIKSMLCDVHLYSALLCSHLTQSKYKGLQRSAPPTPPGTSAPPTVSSFDSSLTSLRLCSHCPSHAGLLASQAQFHLRVFALPGILFAQICLCLPPSPHSQLCPNNAFLVRPLLTAVFHISQFAIPDSFSPISHMTSHAQ